MKYIDPTGLAHESFRDACQYYGADAPDDLAADQLAPIARVTNPSPFPGNPRSPDIRSAAFGD